MSPAVAAPLRLFWEPRLRELGMVLFFLAALRLGDALGQATTVWPALLGTAAYVARVCFAAEPTRSPTPGILADVMDVTPMTLVVVFGVCAPLHRRLRYTDPAAISVRSESEPSRLAYGLRRLVDFLSAKVVVVMIGSAILSSRILAAAPHAVSYREHAAGAVIEVVLLAFFGWTLHRLGGFASAMRPFLALAAIDAALAVALGDCWRCGGSSPLAGAITVLYFGQTVAWIFVGVRVTHMLAARLEAARIDWRALREPFFGVVGAFVVLGVVANSAHAGAYVALAVPTILAAGRFGFQLIGVASSIATQLEARDRV
jgi:hypothetical protein